ncbi:metallophosphoesterase family protein [Halegenticoccus soli]|uniref:metallophosphoesterase family protein n=1 Tax=Halegenticoccus soli TaxID=1985678 RepID=UPI000C6DFB8A|nr:metallophosphoesterase family protein [Halegenticoccus soli]
MTVRFTEPLEAQHRRVDPDDWDDIYVVGDVHGCLAELRALLGKLRPGDDDLVVFVGDLVRKGPNSGGVVDLVRGSPNMLAVRGNNEEKVLRGEKTVPGLAEADVEWLRSLPVAVSWDDALVVHGGVDPRKPLAEHTVDDLQTTRSLAPGGSYDRPFWFERYDGPKRVFFGHTVMERPVVREHAVGLDTGCVYGGALTAYDWRCGEFVGVEADRTVQSRKDSKIVTPRRTAAN